MQLRDPTPQLLKQTGRQHAVVVAPVWSRSQIKSWPFEAVEFIKAQPVTTCIQSELAADIGRNFKRRRCTIRRRMRDRRNDCLHPTPFRPDCNDNRTGAILSPFDSARGPLMAPQKTVADDEARNRRRQFHLGATPYSAASMLASVSSSSSPTISTSAARRLSFS